MKGSRLETEIEQMGDDFARGIHVSEVFFLHTSTIQPSNRVQMGLDL